MSIWKAASASVVILAIVLFVLFIGPVITIWSLNTLFGTGIVLSFESWLATFWITFLLTTAIGSR